MINFEQWATWRRGDQPYGELTQTQEKVRSGGYAAKLRYDFPVTDEDYVVFVRSLSLAGQPNTVGAWVYGDGSGHYLNVWIQDNLNEIWSVHLGRVGASGWQQMAGTLDPNLPWPSGHVSGPENGVVDYPIRFHALVLDRTGSGPRSGQIYIDDISVWQGKPSATVTPAPAATDTPAAEGPTPTPTPTTESPISAEPLDFPKPERLDSWEKAEGGHKGTIIVHISGGVPPFTIRHDATAAGGRAGEGLAQAPRLIHTARGPVMDMSSSDACMVTVFSPDGRALFRSAGRGVTVHALPPLAAGCVLVHIGRDNATTLATRLFVPR